MPARHLLFVNRFFHPDHSATSQMLSDLSFHLAERGWRVEVVSSRQRYDDASSKLSPHETVNGVEATGGSIDAGGPAIANGLVLTNSGYGVWNGLPGNVLLAFSVDR